MLMREYVQQMGLSYTGISLYGQPRRRPEIWPIKPGHSLRIGYTLQERVRPILDIVWKRQSKLASISHEQSRPRETQYEACACMGSILSPNQIEFTVVFG
jgi:hypothetical protein